MDEEKPGTKTPDVNMAEEVKPHGAGEPEPSGPAVVERKGEDGDGEKTGEKKTP